MTRKRMTRKMRIDTRDHQTIAASLAGNVASGKRVVLIHSLAMDHQFWAPVVAALGDAAQVLTYDCRGHGASSKPRQSYTVEQFAGDLVDVLDHLRWDSTVVAGASMGGTVALAFAARYHSEPPRLGSSTPPPGMDPMLRSNGTSARKRPRRRA
jgi:3-oxoadipate enol-lactonase